MSEQATDPNDQSPFNPTYAALKATQVDTTLSDEDELVGWLDNLDVKPSDPEAARQLLASSEYLDKDIWTVLSTLGVSKEKAREIGNSGLRDRLNKVGENRFHEMLAASGFRERLRPDNLTIDQTSSTAGMDAAAASTELIKILEDPNFVFRQGFGWNVAISEQSDFVAKYVKGELSPAQTMRVEMEQFQQVRSVFGDEFLVPQTAVWLKDKETPVLLQQKLVGEWQPIGLFTPDVEATIAQSLRASSENKTILSTFLDRIDQLEQQYGLLFDFSGDNVVFRLDDQGRIDIKIPDYGCVRVDQVGQQDRVFQLHNFSKRIRQLTQEVS